MTTTPSSTPPLDPKAPADMVRAAPRPRKLSTKEKREQDALFKTHRATAQGQLDGVPGDAAAAPPRAQVLGIKEHHQDLIALVQKLSRAPGAALVAPSEVTRDINALAAAQTQLVTLNTAHRLSHNAHDGGWWNANQANYADCRRMIALAITQALSHPYWNDREESENVPVADRLTRTLQLLNKTIEASGEFPSGHTSIDSLNTTITETISVMQRTRKPAKPKAKKDFTVDADFNALRTTDTTLRPLLNRIALEEFWNRTELHVGKREVIGPRAAEMSAEFYSIVQAQDFDGLVKFMTQMNTLETDMTNILTKHTNRPENLEFNPDRKKNSQGWMNIGNLEISVRQKLWAAGIGAGILTVAGLGLLASSANRSSPTRETNPAAEKKEADIPSGTPALRTTISGSPEQDMGIPGFTVRREGSQLKFNMPAGADAAHVKISIGQTGGSITVLSPVQTGAEWIASIDPAYINRATPVRVAVQFYNGMQWVTGSKIEIPLQ